MISGGIEINKLAQIRLILESKFEDHSLFFLDFYISFKIFLCSSYSTHEIITASIGSIPFHRQYHKHQQLVKKIKLFNTFHLFKRFGIPTNYLSDFLWKIDFEGERIQWMISNLLYLQSLLLWEINTVGSVACYDGIMGVCEIYKSYVGMSELYQQNQNCVIAAILIF